MTTLIVITQRHGVLLPRLLPSILSMSGLRLLGVVNLSRRLPQLRPPGNGALDRIKIFGLKTWLVRQFFSLTHRIRAPLEAYRMRAILDRYGISNMEIDDVNDPALLNHIRSLAPDLILSVLALQRFGPDLLRLPRIGCLNIHLGLIPEHRGLCSSFWSLYNGNDEFGVTIHFMNGRLDAGPVIRERRFPIFRDESVLSLERRQIRLVPDLLREALGAVLSGGVRLPENDLSRGNYYSVPSREVLIAFRKERGGRWV
jgi:methionyl-tRNA formyltransferase